MKIFALEKAGTQQQEGEEFQGEGRAPGGQSTSLVSRWEGPQGTPGKQVDAIPLHHVND